MQHKLPALQFELGALSPFISKETLEFHYGKHHAAYVANLNKLIVGTQFGLDKGPPRSWSVSGLSNTSDASPARRRNAGAGVRVRKRARRKDRTACGQCRPPEN